MTESNRSGWTVDTLHQHLDSKIDALQRHIDDKFAEQAKAVAVAESVAEKWRENANEWRATISDRDQRFMLESTALASFKSLEDKINDLRVSRDIGQGRATGMKDFWGWIVGAISVGVAGAALFLRR